MTDSSFAEENASRKAWEDNWMGNLKFAIVGTDLQVLSYCFDSCSGEGRKAFL